MSDYLTRFQAKTRRKADADLIRRWAWDAEFQGDVGIKVQLATARRTATSLEKAKSQFSNLKPEHELAINAAVSAMGTLAKELSALAAWAKDYKVFCDGERKREDAEALEAIAAARWGNDAEAFRFEFDLMRELMGSEGRRAFAAWCHGQGRYQQCALDSILSPIDSITSKETDRATAAHVVRLVMSERQRPNLWTGHHGPTVICSWPDYEAYLAYRKDVVATACRLVQSAANR
jgi:hypothetical protein